MSEPYWDSVKYFRPKMEWPKLVILKKIKVLYFFIGLLFGIGFLLPFVFKESKIRLGEHYIYCNPQAKINFKKTYHLHLWDYNWPIKGNGFTYRTYLQQVVRDFQKIYPNIKVEIKLLDLITGPAQLEQKLRVNDAPDIYCSAFSIPEFNFKQQIPIGFYLKKTEQERYFENAKKILTIHGTLCYFPRWIAPEFWVGNQSLMKIAGLSVAKIQNKGWLWQDLMVARKILPVDKYPLVGNLGGNGFVPQLIANAGPELKSINVNATIDFIERLISQNGLPTDCDRNMLGRFLGGNAMVLAGMRTPIYNLLRRKKNIYQFEWQPVLLPIPSRFLGKESFLVKSGAISVYRNRRTKGDDHLTAAVRLSQYLSCYPKTIPWEYLMFCPMAKEVYQQWIKRESPNEVLYNRLIEQINIEQKHPVDIYQDGAYSVLKDFISRKLTGKEVKLKLMH
jgi:hypothetical protein